MTKMLKANLKRASHLMHHQDLDPKQEQGGTQQVGAGRKSKYLAMNLVKKAQKSP